MSESVDSPGSAEGALHGLRVLELGHGVAGPFAARLLADLGAEVIKVEPPGGDFSRRLAPFATDDEGVRTSLLHTYLNWNKRGTVLDLAASGAAERLKPLVVWADIVIESFRPGRLARWGFGFDLLTQWRPGLVLTSVSNFGQFGPRSQDLASDLIFYALSGLSSISGFADPDPPIKHGLRQSLYGAGMTAAYSALAGHRLARLTGAAQHVDVSIHECVASEMVTPWSFYSFAGAVQGRHPRRADPLDGLPLRAAEGFVAFQLNDRAPISSLAQLIGDPDLADPRWMVDEFRVRHAHQLRASLEAGLARRPAVDWFVEASERGVLAGLVQGAEELLSCAQLRSRQALRPVPRQSSIRFPAELARLTRTSATVRTPAPYLGEHDEQIVALSRSLGAAAPAAAPG
ncbi:MAG TPA: CoA transferase, partial [Micromonosporaceae bacterium]